MPAVTLHLHVFVYGAPAGAAASATGATERAGTGCPAAPVLTPGEAALLGAALGGPELLNALPGGPSVAGGMTEQPQGTLSFGVALWQRLPAGLMQWPVWLDGAMRVVRVVAWRPHALCMYGRMFEAVIPLIHTHKRKQCMPP